METAGRDGANSKDPPPDESQNTPLAKRVTMEIEGAGTDDYGKEQLAYLANEVDKKLEEDSNLNGKNFDNCCVSRRCEGCRRQLDGDVRDVKNSPSISAKDEAHNGITAQSQIQEGEEVNGQGKMAKEVASVFSMCEPAFRVKEYEINRQITDMVDKNTKEGCLAIENLCSQTNLETDEELDYPPSFEPQQLRTVRTDGNKVKKSSENLSQHTNDKDPHNIKGNKRITRSSTRSMEAMEKEATEIWTFGKKLGLYSNNEEAVLKELAKDDSPYQNARSRKRGRPRKQNH